LNRTEKEEAVSGLGELFNSIQIGLLVDYRGLDVAEITELRRQLNENATKMRVLKNRLAKQAIKESPFAELGEYLTEPRALIYGDDPVAPAKVVSKFMSTNTKLDYISGMLLTGTVGSVLDANRMKALGNLPSREELLTKLVFVMNAVPTKLVRTLNEVPAKFVRTLAALAQSKEGA